MDELIFVGEAPDVVSVDQQREEAEAFAQLMQVLERYYEILNELDAMGSGFNWRRGSLTNEKVEIEHLLYGHTFDEHGNPVEIRMSGVAGVVRGAAQVGRVIARTRGVWHHIATNKYWRSMLHGGPWSPRFLEIFRGAGLKLNDAINKVRVVGHFGPHPQAYHQAVYNRLVNATQGLRAGTPAYSAAVVKALEKLAKDVATPGHPLNRMLTGR